ncbi:hypothetical protein L9F63_021865 [Diploptera punctata]|uniref:Uncharacterized protein n=1 Tax=Diploptera punctata TaxID=6984 RepID=A0AAD7ZN57_DIPPU|nr:hypothetical protein L9F63_021865 [Diploptera punctata]
MASESSDTTVRRSRRRTRRCDQTRSGRLVILVQIVSWCSDGYSSEVNSTSTVLAATSSSRDAHNNTTNSDVLIDKRADGVRSTSVHNSTSPPRQKRAGMKINPSSAILITVGTTMLVIGPTLLLAKVLDSRRTGRDSVKIF